MKGIRVAKEQGLELEGTVVESLPNCSFRVKIPMKNTEVDVIATLSGRLRQKFIRVVTGDKVRVEFSPYDLGKGRIVYRL